jgi:hypothetical protein
LRVRGVVAGPEDPELSTDFCGCTSQRPSFFVHESRSIEPNMTARDDPRTLRMHNAPPFRRCVLRHPKNGN